ncbi:MAG: EAL domain-containing protein [Lachnospiraceae bacterium]|nr:EAL domain-containing protein [Lachnospiraceae bacterium]
MSNIIGVCVTRVQGEMCRTFLGCLLKGAEAAGYRVCVFQSVYDFDEMDESGAGYVFDMIPFDELCAVIILHDTIYDIEIKNRIIERATEKGLPVIMARDIDPRCYSLIGDFEESYYELLTKVIEKNSVSDVYYIGGRRNSGVDSRKRIELFRNVCEEKCIYFDDTRLGYGEYYELPTYKIIDALLEGGKKPPRAIFCANDIMALAVIEKIESYGYKVPEDTVVVGFDGLESAKYSKPRLTTCSESMDNLTELALEVIGKAINEGIAPGVFKYKYAPVFAESAGFESRQDEMTDTSLEIFRRFRSDEADEEASNAWLDLMMNQQDLEGFKYILPKLLNKKREIYIRPEAYWKFSDGEESRRLPERLTQHSIDGEGVAVKEEKELGACVRDAVLASTDDSITIFSAISMHKVVFGLSVDHSSDPFNEGGSLNRFAVTLDRGFSLAISGERQLYLAEKINRSRYIDPLTGMLNIDGASRWYKNYVSDDISEKSYMLIGVYALVTYQEILNIYGADFLETCLKFIASTLLDMNPYNVMIARISSDSFAVAYIFENEHNSSNEIDVTINTFFTVIESKKKESEKWGMMEVSCGYVSDELQDNDSLDGYLNAAVATLYRNRAALHKKAPSKMDSGDGEKILEYRSKLVDLIQKDRFVYHFQPIVSAVTGEIVAYEALMRTQAEVGMNPLEVLDAAEMFDKFADLERTTFQHIFRRIKSQKAEFEGKKVFVNTIPGHFLTDIEVRNLRQEFGELLNNITIEITESQTISPKEVDAINHLASDEFKNDIAVDDYGMGHSNIVNLLEYKPEVVKVDRYLISNIQNDKNKQLFVKNLIEFASDAHIKVLAEGVETSEELRTVINFGVDLIQGYYTARPAFEVIQALTDEIREEILRYNREKTSEL